MDRPKQLREIQDEAYDLFVKKNADYGDAFAKYGTVGVMMRMEDKMLRYLSVAKNEISLINTESLRDTLLDLHNYSAMAVMLLDETKEKEEKKESMWIGGWGLAPSKKSIK
jgi:hypothetical protein